MTGVTVFYSSDTHFSHALVAGLRGFASQEEHDEAVIANWNAVVKPSDLVWHLGDAGLGSEARVLELAGRLNGVKHLIAGNHDRCWPGHRDARKRQRAWLEAFESVQAFAKTPHRRAHGPALAPALHRRRRPHGGGALPAVPPA